MNRERIRTRRASLSIFISLTSIVCFFACGGAAYSQNRQPIPSPPAPTYWFFPGPTPNYFAGVYGQFGSFAGLIGPAVTTGFETTVDLAYGAGEVAVAYGSLGNFHLPNTPAWKFSPLMQQYDLTVKCQGQDAANERYSPQRVISGLVEEAGIAAQHSLTVDGSTALMDWWANFGGGTLGGAIATAPIGALPWRLPSRPPSTAVRPVPIRGPTVVVEPDLQIFINGRWVPVENGAQTTAVVPRPRPATPSESLLPHNGGNQLLPRPTRPLLPLPPLPPPRSGAGRPTIPELMRPNVYICERTGYLFAEPSSPHHIPFISSALDQVETVKTNISCKPPPKKWYHENDGIKYTWEIIAGANGKPVHSSGLFEEITGSSAAGWSLVKCYRPKTNDDYNYHFAVHEDGTVILHYFVSQRPPKE